MNYDRVDGSLRRGRIKATATQNRAYVCENRRDTWEMRTSLHAVDSG
jgi:hypothetical protein